MINARAGEKLMGQNDLFIDSIQKVGNGGLIGGYRDLTDALMLEFCRRGMTLEFLSGKRVMNRSIKTLRGHARRLGLEFPDYVPRALRQKAGK